MPALFRRPWHPCVSALSVLLVILTASCTPADDPNAKATAPRATAEPVIAITRAVFGTGRGSAQCATEIRAIITDRHRITEISTPGLGLKNPQGVVRDRLVIEFTAQGIPGSVVFKNGEKVNLYEAIMKAAGQLIAAAPATKPDESPSTAEKIPAPPIVPATSLPLPKESRGKGYVVIPVRGIVGHHFTDALLQEALLAAEKAGVNTVVLSIDSTGGTLAETEKITQRLVNWQSEGRVIACVMPRAHGASFLLAIACKEIIMAPASTIGGSADSGPRLTGVIKLQPEPPSRISDRALAQFGGHDPALVEAMRDPSVELWMTPNAQAAPTFVALRAGGGSPPKSAVIAKARGAALTLTADDAVQYGLTVGVSVISKVGEKLGIEPWKEATDGPSKAAGAAYGAAEEAGNELARLSDLITTSLAAPLTGNAAMLAKLLEEQRAARLALTRIEKISAASPYYTSLIDAASLTQSGRDLDARIAMLEEQIVAEKR